MLIIALLKRYMQNLNKKLIIFAIFTLIIAGFYIIIASSNNKKPIEEFRNVILVGWDGAKRDNVHELLAKGELPNLKSLTQQGRLVNIDITSGKTETKPGWAEILTGYNSEFLGVISNKVYKPIRQGYSVFERLEDYFGKNITTVFITGKDNNTGARGPHTLCTNCITRDFTTFNKTGWWEEGTNAPTIDGGERIIEKREGEPYYLTKSALDVYRSGLGEAKNVGKRALELLQTYNNRPFFMFIHFEEPDEPGHRYGETSKEYAQGIITDDYWLGEIIKQLKKLKLYDKTLIYVTADHGFDEGQRTHRHAPYVFLATNDPKVKKNGTRLDVAPTILKRYGFDLQKISPRLDGKSLLGID